MLKPHENFLDLLQQVYSAIAAKENAHKVLFFSHVLNNIFRIGTHVKWICVSVMSKASAIIADINAFSRQRWRTYKPSERQQRPVRSGFARRASPAQQTFDEVNLEGTQYNSNK